MAEIDGYENPNSESIFSTGTATAAEIYDHLRGLWAAVGIPQDSVAGERMSE